MPNLTDKYVDNLTATAGKKILTVYDSELKGFAVAVMSSGTKTYLYRYRTPEGIQRKSQLLPAKAGRLDNACKAD